MMNYEPNKINWKIGDVVVHDADAKKEYMLMKVIEVLSDGQIKTELIDPYIGRNSKYHKPLSQKDRTFINDKKYLHDPARFGLKIP